MTTPNPFAYPGPITLDTLGDLFAHHRDRFGGFRMEDEPDDKPEPKADDKAKEYTPPASQADLDRIISDRINRERAKFEGFDDYKKKAAEFDKAAEAARTDQEKAVAAARDEGKTEALTAANARLVSAEARALAAEAKFRNPTLAVRALDLKDVTVNDSGEVDAAAVKAKLKELSDADPYLLDDGKKPTPKPDRAQGGNEPKSDASVARGRDMFDNRRGAKKTPA